MGSDPRGGRDGDSTSPGSDEPDGSGDARSPWTSEAHGRREPQLSPEAQTGQTASPSLIADLCEAWHNINLQEHVDPVDIFGDKDEGDVIFHTRETNWVAQEMWEHFAQKGIFPNSTMLKQCRADLFEVYCNYDSQLTKQAQNQGLWAERHCLDDGDLTLPEGRKRLYDRLLQLRPRDIWLSPKCTAWCKWNEFNRSRSPELAAKIMQAREDDMVHLLLCDALFQFQTCRSPDCHAHLEQPSGSQMLYQEEMSAILEQSYIGRCDMCQAGRLQHPETQKPLQKRTQVVTTSQIMYRRIETLQCNHMHEHDTVAGSCRHPQLGRILVSQFSELYTRTFAEKVIRCLQCSRNVGERNWTPTEFAMVTRPAESEDNSNMPSLKCRRIGEKQAPSAAYQQLQEQQKLERMVQCAMKIAPKVGKRFFMEGELVQEVQKSFPDMKIVGVETCKGADRCGPPPKEISSQRAPFRRTLGINRQTSQVFCDETWEEWHLLKRKQLIRNCQPARLLITVFAQSLKPVENDAMCEPGSSSSPIPRASGEAPEDSSKRIRLTEPEPNETVQPEQKPMHVQNPDPEPSGVRAEHGLKFMQLSAEQRQQLIRMHNNLGHPDSTLLGNVLKDQKWPPEAIEGIKDMHCSACFERQKPRLARPSHLGEPRQFNDLVAIDSIKWTNAQGQHFLFYHIIDTGSNYHVAIPCEHRPNSEQLSQLFNKYWINWAGPPKMLLHDSAGEFCSEEFARYLQGYDFRSSTIPAEAHWQLGRCERHGAILQAMLEKWQVHHPISCFSDFEMALSHNVAAKNSLSRHRGYSPEILVLGKSRHVPACNTNEEVGPADWLADNASNSSVHTHDAEVQSFMRNLSMREQARIAFVKADHDMKLRRSLLRRSRPDRGQFLPNQWVMYWRSGKGTLPGSWHGPARVIMPESQGIVWVSHQSRLYRCAPEHLRNLSQRESEIPEVRASPEPPPFPQAIGTGVFQYQDLTSQPISNAHEAHNNDSNPPQLPEIVPNQSPSQAITTNASVPSSVDQVHNSPPGNHEEVQPDAEPDAHSQSSHSEPNIHHHDPNHRDSPPPTLDNLPSTIPPGGIDVALPDTDDGEDSLLATKVTQDYWEICKGKVSAITSFPDSRCSILCASKMFLYHLSG